ncbi:MAG: hypothetical protein A2X40_04560 [Elusimicrobia bacterium GWC2_65_9]|nr:MAG: hypothetical protein A2X37_08960 [Elusimicrobia bacterium GWA2_66_18]OGR68856.1 MAG: hypothetical protein A2X40_04560 [Elusimicrobia bacterium GWC2_65_9]
MRWLDSADQARLRALSLSPRRPAAAPGAPGRHRSLARGYSRDFAQHRPYASGDEARAIDWKAYARLDRFYVREYRAEDRFPLAVLVDTTASMAFSGEGRGAKFDLARRLAAALSWVALEQGDEAGLFPAGPGAALPPRAGSARLPEIDAALTALAPSREPDLAAALESAAAALPPRAVAVLISDLMGDTARILKALRRLSAGRRELLVLRVLDPEERDFPYEGSLRVRGLEGGEILIDAAEAARPYREAFRRQDDAYRASLRRSGVPYAVASTDAPWHAPLARLLE